MSRFTSGERRGTIAVLLIMAIIVAYLAVSGNVHSSAPKPLPDTVKVAAPAGLTMSDKTDSAKTTKKRKTSKKEKKPQPQPSPRQVLDEPITE